LTPVARSRKPDLPVPEPARNYAARGIAALLAPVVRPAFRKRAPAAAALLADWESLAGPEFAARAAPVKFAGGTLTLACTGPAAMELQLVAPTLIARLNLALGQQMIERLRFTRQAPKVLGQSVSLPRHMAAPPKDLPDGALGEALARLYEGVKK